MGEPSGRRHVGGDRLDRTSPFKLTACLSAAADSPAPSSDDHLRSGRHEFDGGVGRRPELSLLVAALIDGVVSAAHQSSRRAIAHRVTPRSDG